jgi:hypothetical protein
MDGARDKNFTFKIAPAYYIVNRWNRMLKYNIKANVCYTTCTLLFISKLKLTNSVAFSPQANYTDRTTAACRRS